MLEHLYDNGSFALTKEERVEFSATKCLEKELSAIAEVNLRVVEAVMSKYAYSCS